MKKLLSLLLIMAMLSSVSAFAVTEVEYTFKGEDGYVYHFGTFGAEDEDAGLVINGKKYSLTGGTHSCTDENCENAFDHAKNYDNRFGMGIKLENGEDSYTMAPYATVAGNDNVAEVPETVTVATVEAFPEAEEEDDVYERGTFTLDAIYKLERNTGSTNFSRWLADDTNSTSSVSRGRVYDAKGDPRDEHLLKFNTTVQGLNEEDKVILTVGARAENDLGVSGGSVRIVGIVDENYAYNTSLPTVDRTYTFTTTKGLTRDFQDYSFDVTSYVKARLLSGSSQISFLVEMVDADWKTEDSGVYMDLAIAPYTLAPKLEYKKTELSSLSYDNNNIEIKDGQYTYVVTLDNGSSIPYVSAKALNSTVEITQATSIPGTAIVSVNTNGSVTQYKVNFITSDYVGVANAGNIFYATRITNAAWNKGIMDGSGATLLTSSSSIQVRTDSNKAIRQEGMVEFNIQNLLGVADGKKVILTVYGNGNNNAITNGTKVVYRGIVGEGIVAGCKYDTDVNYAAESANVVTADASTAYTFDVTEYVKSKIEKGETTASFAIRITEGGENTTFYWYCTGDKVPTLTLE